MAFCDYDVVVVGGGIIGLSTARFLVKLGCKTLLLDQFNIPHSYGSSHGKSRGIRYTYSTYQHAEMIPEAFKEWRHLENETCSELLIKTGIICMCSPKEQQEMACNMKKLEVGFKLMSSKEIEQKFCGLNSCGMTGIFDEEAGILKATDCLWALKNSFMAKGGCIKQEHLLKVIPIDSKCVQLETNKQIYTARSVVLTCGPWTNEVLKSVDIHLPIVVRRSLILYWKTRNPQSYLCDTFPLSCVTKPDILSYAVPVMDYPGYVKIGIHDGVELKNPSDRDKVKSKSEEEQEDDHINALKDVITAHYPDVIPEVSFKENCMYSTTPDEDFILDTHPRFSNVVIGAGFSGHGFKLAPVIGSILGKLALGKKQTYSLKPFRLDRFDKPPVKSSL